MAQFYVFPSARRHWLSDQGEGVLLTEISAIEHAYYTKNSLVRETDDIDLFYLARFGLEPGLESVDTTDCEILTCFRQPRPHVVNAEYLGGCFAAFRIGESTYASGYYLSLGTGSHYNRLSLVRREANGNWTMVVGGSSRPTISGLSSVKDFRTKKVLLRARIAGSNLMAKAWVEGHPEPEGWMIDVADATWSVGDAAIGIYSRGSIQETYFVTLGTDNDPAPMPETRVVVGAVLLPDSSPAAGYIVRCHRRQNGLILAETLTDSAGNFTMDIQVLPDEQVYCLAIDQLGNSWNAPIQDLVKPSIEV